MDVVVAGAVDQEQGIGQPVGVGDGRGVAVAVRVVLRVVEVALGPDGVVEAPVGDRRAGDRRRPGAGAVEHRVEGVGAAAGPAPEADAVRVDPPEALQVVDPGELCRQVARAEAAIGAVFAPLAEEGRSAVVDHQDGVAALGHHLVPQAAAARAPAVGHHLRGGAAVVVHDRRVAARRVEAVRPQQGRRQLDPVRAGDGQELPARQSGRVVGGRRAGQLEQQLAIAVAHRQARRLVGVAQRVHPVASAGSGHGRVPAGRRRQPIGEVPFERAAQNLAVLGAEATAAVGGEDEPAAVLVDRVERGHRPALRGESGDDGAVGGVQVELPPAALLGRPEEAAVGEEPEVVVEVEPGRPAFGQQDPAGAARGVAGQQIEAVLVAIQPLDGHPFARRQPVDARQVDVGLAAGVEPDGVAALERHDADAHPGVDGAGLRVALLLDAGVGDGGEVDERVEADLAVVEPVVGDALAVRAPPEAGRVAAPDLLPVDPVGDAVEDLALAAALGQRPLGAAGQVEEPEVVVPHEGDAGAVGRELGVLLLVGGLGEPAGAAVGGVDEVQVAAGLEKDPVAGRGPVVAAELEAVLVAGLADEGTAAARLDHQRPQGLAAAVVPEIAEDLAARCPRQPAGHLAARVVAEQEIEAQPLRRGLLGVGEAGNGGEGEGSGGDDGAADGHDGSSLDWPGWGRRPHAPGGGWADDRAAGGRRSVPAGCAHILL